MIKKITFSIFALTTIWIASAKAQPGITPQYPYIQAFDSLTPFQTIEGQYGWLNGNFFGVDQSTVSVYASRGINNSNAMSTALNNFSLTDSILSPMLGTFTVATELSFYYRIVQPTLNLPQTLAGDGGIKLSILPYLGSTPEPEQELYRVSVSNHIDSSGYRKITMPLSAFAGKTGHIKFSYYQGAPGDDYIADIDSFVVNEPTVTALINTSNESFAVVINEQNQIIIRNNQAQSNNSMVSIFDLNGKLVYNANLIANKSIDGSFWNKGIYFLQISDAKSTFNTKIIVR